MKKAILIGVGAVVAIFAVAIGVFVLTGPDLGDGTAGAPTAGSPTPPPESTPPATASTPPASPAPTASTPPASPAPTDASQPPPGSTPSAAPDQRFAGQTPPGDWVRDFPKTDFSVAGVDFGSIKSGGPPRDGIPAIDDPQFGTVAEAADILAETEPVISVASGGVAKAYPLAILMYHEIVNDEIGGTPIAVTFCPLCNSTIVYHAELDGQLLDFGTTGRLRNSDLVMYDRQTETWWQQFTGEGLIGTHTGRRLEMLPSRVEAFSLFQQRYPEGQVLKIPEDYTRNYGINPYFEYDQAGVDPAEQRRPFLFRGELPDGIPPLAYVVAVDDRAWSLDMLREAGRVETEDGLIIEWAPGQSSALDKSRISDGHDIGNVTVQRLQDGELVDVVYDVSFAFAFNAFRPEGEIIQ